MSDGYVQVVPDSTGKRVDASELTLADGSTLVERQRIVISDREEAALHARVGARGLAVQTDDILIELRSIRELLQEILQLQQETLH